MTPLLPPKYVNTPAFIVYHPSLPDGAKTFYSQIRGLAWQNNQTTPWLTVKEIEAVTGRKHTAIYGYMRSLELIAALLWRTSGDARLMFSFPDLSNSAIPESPNPLPPLESPPPKNDKEEEEEPQFRKPGFAETAIATYQANISPMASPIDIAHVKKSVEIYGEEWVLAAIAEAVICNSRSWKYIAAILERWLREGFRSGKNAGKAEEYPDPDESNLPEENYGPIWGQVIAYMDPDTPSLREKLALSREIGFEHNRLLVVTPNAEWLTKRMTTTVKRILAGILNTPDPEIEFMLEEL